ncbi:MAG TPA: 23S rRNA (cytidine(2498)-2'-O)-methyltransferase RlmM [Gammaproteobacteria bacterium]|nr:23S rRNA (cytidine(2498)-2'-O)-methyltransferase RlmM [Gammaproteobacteria bacterium]
MRAVLLQCRAGFENECAAEIMDRARSASVAGWCRASPGTGFVRFETSDEAPGTTFVTNLDVAGLVFARQGAPLVAELAELPEADRVTPLVAAVRGSTTRLSGIFLEYPDTNTGKALSVFCRRFAAPLTHGLRAAGIATDAAGAPRLQVFFTDSRHAFVGLVDPARAAPWPMGIPRLKMPRGAPSRSTLKLDEAFQVLLGAEERARLLRPGLRAVDLGAAPGGWTWQFVRRHIAVVAVDNGALDPALLESGLVEHRREDGFRYRPPRPVDWLVCDMVEQPRRITALVADWLARGDCRQALFNLKLPMKQRYAMVQECLAAFEARLAREGLSCLLRCKQLYHDREEVTVFARLPE